MTWGGWCPWCDNYCTDVALVAVIEQGSGPGGSVYACLKHARPRVNDPNAPTTLRQAVAEMEQRAAPAHVNR